MAKTKGAIRTQQNTHVKKLLLKEQDIVDQLSYEQLIQNWIDDCIVGSAGQHTGTERIASFTIYKMLTTLDIINSRTVDEYFNHKRISVGNDPLSERMIRYYTAVARCASQGIQHQMFVKGIIEEVPRTYVEKPYDVMPRCDRVTLSDYEIFSIVAENRCEDIQEANKLILNTEITKEEIESLVDSNYLDFQEKIRFKFDYNNKVEYESVDVKTGEIKSFTL